MKKADGDQDDHGHGSCTIDNLRQGETYTFRVTAFVSSIGNDGKSVDTHSDPSLPSDPLTIPLIDIPSSNVAPGCTQGALSSRRSSTSSGSGSCSGSGTAQVN